MVNWPLKRFLTVIITMQLALLALVVSSTTTGFDIPVLRQALGFVCLTLFPGLVILRLLRLKTLGTVETLLYSVGLSLALVMFLGLFINTAFPLAGISRPISTFPLIITLTAMIVLLCVILYMKERREGLPYSRHIFPAWSEVSSPPTLFLLLLPVLSILGAHLSNHYGNNILLLIVIGLIALTIALIAFNRFIPVRMYPLAILMIAVSLLWHWSLISQYIWGTDIHHEYYSQSVVLNNGVWDPSIRSSINAMLSITMLAPIYSLLLGMDSVWLFKIVYPLLFSLLPLALFQIFRKQTDDRIAFFATFFFMSFFGFFSTMNQLARQQVAELFLVFFVLLLLDNTMAPAKRRLLLVIWGFCIVVSHYGLSYFFLFYLVLSLLLLYLMRWSFLGNIQKNIAAGLHINQNPGEKDYPITPTAPFSATIVFLFIVFCFAWYLYIGRASLFNYIVNLGVHAVNSLRELFILETRETGVLMALGLSSPTSLVTSVQRNIFLIIQYCTQFFIVAGVIWLLINLRKKDFQPFYKAMTVVSGLVLLLCIVLPRFSSYLNMDRIYHITLLFLSPFFILGGITVFRWLFRLVPVKSLHVPTNTVFLNLTVILISIPYFLFSTAFIYAVTGDRVTSIALNPDMDFPRYNQQEVSGKGWLLANITGRPYVFTNLNGAPWLVEPPFMSRTKIFWGDTGEISDNAFIFLRSINVKQNKVLQSKAERGKFGEPKYIDLWSSTFGEKVLAHQDKIYDNGGAQIYHAGR